MTRTAPVRLLCVLPAVTGGGAERFFLEFLRSVNRTCFVPHAALLYRGGGFESEIANDVPVHYLDGELRITGVQRYWDRIRGAVKLGSMLDSFDAVLSFGSLFNGFVALSARLARFRGPVIIIEVIHESSTGHQSRVAKLLRRLFLVFTYTKVTTVVAVSKGVADDLHERFGISSNVRVILNGLDLAHIRQKAELPVGHPWLNRDRDSRILVSVGRLVEQKGFKYLVEAMALLPHSVRLILVGDGEERDALESLATTLGVSDRVSFVGYDRNPYRYIARADIFVMPSLFEGFGLVLIEALALGVPIVATDCVAGPAEVLADGTYGRLVPPGDARALAQAIQELLDDPAELDRLSDLARERAELFALGRAVQAYEGLLLGSR